MLKRDPEYPYERGTLDDLIEWCEGMGKDDHSMARRENAPMVIARYLRFIKRNRGRNLELKAENELLKSELQVRCGDCNFAQLIEEKKKGGEK